MSYKMLQYTIPLIFVTLQQIQRQHLKGCHGCVLKARGLSCWRKQWGKYKRKNFLAKAAHWASTAWEVTQKPGRKWAKGQEQYWKQFWAINNWLVNEVTADRQECWSDRTSLLPCLCGRYWPTVWVNLPQFFINKPLMACIMSNNPGWGGRQNWAESLQLAAQQWFVTEDLINVWSFVENLNLSLSRADYP